MIIDSSGTDYPVDEVLAMGIDSEWWDRHARILKPSSAMEYPEVKAWRAEKVALGATVLSDDEWDRIHGR